MGSGKTTLLEKLIGERFSLYSILMITPNITTSCKLYSLFPQFTMYSDHRGTFSVEKHPRLIICCKSLHRMEHIFTGLSEHMWDVVIIDEFATVISMIGSSALFKNTTMTFRERYAFVTYNAKWGWIRTK